ncbi:lysozyme [Hyphococcus flavus]|uniref:Lysozyme n=1 Tax=Hyphococcus flavus TaxID=1866326 RepID=A0AAE9ZFH7_9PROT|nr:lysozyme [Hyphococcus flavus]WDI31787.1 lysozyme [Hyphococcus flavus]
MRTGETGLNLIKGYEGLRMSAHYAPTEQWTVGYGHTGSARHGMSVTEGDAERLLKDDVQPIEQLIGDTVRAPLNQNEHDALVSLIFNIGEDNWKRSTVLRKLNAGDKIGAANAFELWTKAFVNNELATLDGLVRRRAAEKSLFLMPTDAALVVPSSDVLPAAECEPEFVSDRVMNAKPLVDFEKIKHDSKRELAPEERAARTRALFAATQALSGDPSKMIVSKAEERADMGVTIGALLAGMLAFVLTGIGVILLLGQEAPGIAEALGLSYDRFAALFENLPIWLSATGAAMCYFILYILVKRTARHDLKRQRARDLARMRVAE